MPEIRGNPVGKWAARAAVATQDYKDGIQGAGKKWEEATVAATANQAAGVQAALQRGAYANGVRKAGGGKWERKAADVGSQRFAQGVNAAQGDYEAAVTPYFAVIEQTKLPPRGPKGDPNNINRVIVLNKALREKKLQLQGGTR